MYLLQVPATTVLVRTEYSLPVSQVLVVYIADPAVSRTGGLLLK